MRRCVLVSGICSRRAGSDVDGAAETSGAINEKRVRNRRDWSAIASTVLRLLQFAYFVFAYHSLQAFQRSSYFHEDGPWPRSPGEMHSARRMMRWARMQASVILIYHAFALAVPCLLRLLRPARWPFRGLATLFGDGCAMVALLNIMVQLDGAHEHYCHRPPPRDDSITHAMLSFGKEPPSPHDMARHRASLIRADGRYHGLACEAAIAFGIRQGRTGF
ncbi:d8577e3e-cf55-41dd-8313-b0e4d495a2c7 [Thermothielavioides terrestris]|uniref:D8577e3e-cf55-41dd-8313-b0e4d495a2c7 n=1 Tax=Thermothielavioides terrestris TaxID=2587410 RepID=A0A3S4BB53_9PEZI|nr:d8577e3e-cf55-41dd-8313-b0e4d495a2c7 [Thermothielavioides terrestris]